MNVCALSRQTWWFCAAILLLASSVLPLPAATPRAEVLRLVPDDVGFCLLVQDLRQHSAQFLESPFYKEFQTSPLGKALADTPEMQKLRDVEQMLKKHLNTSWAQVRDDILGDAVVFAYKPGPVGKPAEEQGLILLHARDPQLLANLVDRLNETQKKSGELKQLDAREHNRQKYYRRVTAEETNFYYVKGPLLVFGTKEGILKQAIDLDQAGKDKAASTVGQKLQELKADKGLASLWINPRAFEPEIREKAKAPKDASEGAFLKQFLVYWQAFDGAALFLDAAKDLEVGLTIRLKEDKLPASARKVFAELAKPSELWSVFPDNALFAAAGRIDFPALVEMLGEFLTPESRKAIHDAVEDHLGAALGQDVFKEIVPYLGPDAGVCVTAPDPGAKEWVPHMIAAVKVRPGKDGARVDHSLFMALNSYAMLAVIDNNRKSSDKMALKSVMQDKVEVKYLVNDKRFPAGFQPAFSIKGEYLVVGSSPEAIRRFTPEKASLKNEKPSSENPLARMSLADLRKYLKDRKGEVVTFVAEWSKISKEEATRRLDALLMGLHFFDRLELTHKPGAGLIGLSLRIKPAFALKK